MSDNITSDYLLLTPEQATTVAGPAFGAPYAVLAPFMADDGNYYLPAAVLVDPDHAAHHELLSDCPVVSYANVEPLLAGAA
jgi:hypothetical protein